LITLMSIPTRGGGTSPEAVFDGPPCIKNKKGSGEERNFYGRLGPARKQERTVCERLKKQGTGKVVYWGREKV